MSEQTERAFQKQAAIFQNKKRVIGKAVKAKDQRFVKNVGLGFKTPREAVEGTYIDKKCPFTGNVSIRGRILTGIVKSMKMNRTIVLRRDYLHFIKKYQRSVNISCVIIKERKFCGENFWTFTIVGS